jgi:hypothetical protein
MGFEILEVRSVTGPGFTIEGGTVPASRIFRKDLLAKSITIDGKEISVLFEQGEVEKLHEFVRRVRHTGNVNGSYYLFIPSKNKWVETIIFEQTGPTTACFQIFSEDKRIAGIELAI